MNLPKGKGWFIWNVSACENGDPAAIAALARAAGVGHVLIKIADGLVPWNGALVAPVARALRAIGVQVFGWHYVYSFNPAGEATIAVNRMHELELDGLVYNAEQQFRDNPNNRAAANTLLARTRDRLPGIPVGLSSYRYPRYHPQFPWREFLFGIDFNMPQVYWIHATNAGAQLKASYDEFRAMAPRLPFIPTGAAFKEHGWSSTPTQILDFLRTAQDIGLEAVNFWEWGHTRRNLPLNWDAVAQFPWPPEPVQEPDDTAWQIVALQNMNIRSGPGLKYPVVGSLTAGAKRPVLGVGGTDVWVEIAPGRYAAMQTGGKTYLKQV